MIAPNNVREWFAFYGGEESGISFELASKIWEAATNVANKGNLKLFDNAIERLETVSTIIGGTSVPSREELDCASEELDCIIERLRAGALFGNP